MREDNHQRLLEWAISAIGPAARLTAVRPLHDGQGPWHLTVEHQRRTTACILRAPTPRIDAPMIATGAAALELAEHHRLPAPRLLAADTISGVAATLEAEVPGTTSWPSPPSLERLHAAGAALAPLHRIVLAPSADLPFRPRPIAVDDFAADRRTGRMPTTPLLQTADEQIRASSTPVTDCVFVHGDVWPGNLLWAGDQVAALIDWKTAGVGHPGIDLSELRKQVAITFGPEAPAHVLHGYERAAGARFDNLAYWDAVAALNTPTTLYSPTATTRRDTFLHQALAWPPPS